MRYFACLLVAGFVIVGSLAESARSGSYCRSLSENEASAIVGASGDVFECKRKEQCWNLIPFYCFEIHMDPSLGGSDEGTVALQCSQEAQVQLFSEGPNETCQKSKKDENECYENVIRVDCKKVTKCKWDDMAKECVINPALSITFDAPKGCLNQ